MVRPVQTFGLRVQPSVVLVGVVLAGALSVAALVGYAVVERAPLVEELVWVGRDGGRLGSLAPVTTAVTLLRGTLLVALGEELLFRGRSSAGCVPACRPGQRSF